MQFEIIKNHSISKLKIVIDNIILTEDFDYLEYDDFMNIAFEIFKYKYKKSDVEFIKQLYDFMLNDEEKIEFKEIIK